MQRFAFLLVLVVAAVACGSTVEGGGSGGSSGSGGGAGGGLPDFTACNMPEQCTVTLDTCCGVCGENGMDEVTAVNGQYAQAYRDSLCGEAWACDACEGWISSKLFAYCEAGACVAADARVHDVSACSTSQDCTLRYGLACCPGCMSHGYPDMNEDIIAVSVQGEQLLEQLVCGPGFIGCQECAPAFPSNVQAVCDQGHCKVDILSSP